MKNRIYFFANFGDWKKQPLGGGEVGNRKTLDLFRQIDDLEIKLIPKYLRVTSRNPILIGWRMCSNVIKYTGILLLGRRRRSVVHIAGFYGNMIFFEHLLVSIARFLGYFVVYEMRGGGAVYHYEHDSDSYRRLFRKTIKKANYVFTQGLENNPLIKSCDKDARIFYYPNYVMKGFYPEVLPKKDTNTWNFIYFGRISAKKKTDLIIDVFLNLAKRIDNIHLTILGNTEEPEFLASLIQKVSETDYCSNIEFLPACGHENLKTILSRQHFYIFPSTEHREGHSNALTEAMSWGIVPFASSQGFSRSVIANDSLIVDKVEVDAFVNTIAECIANGQYDTLSHQVYERVVTNYTDEIVLSRVKQVYSEIFDSLS